MGKVRVLSAVLINQIAAGEVIVRPASVVKELLENAIDAGATRVRVEVDRSCRDITVVDDGEGMPPEDAELAIERHATSKIADLDDLSGITTRGFRGEALASIAAVSRLEILTRRKDDLAGYRIALEGGRMASKGPVGCAQGTTARVRDLFFNTPARRKFLKSDTSEFNAIMQLLTRQMLARGDVGFTILHGERKIVELPPDQPLAPRMVHLLGNLAETDLLKVNSDRHGVRVYGYVTRPAATRKDRREQYFFVNARPVTHRTMGYSLEQAYHGLLTSGRHPVCCLFIDVPPGEVDVNVHPTKEEVRFRDEGKVTGVLNHAVVDVLRGANLAPQMALPQREPEPAPAKTPGQAPDASPPSVHPVHPIQTGAPSAPGARLAPEGARSEALHHRAEQLGLQAPSSPYPKRPLPDLPIPEKPRLPPSRPQPDESQISNLKSEISNLRSEIPPVPLGQAADSYLVATVGDDLLIVDQHAAHERINFNRVMAMLERGASEAQSLLMPITFDIAAGDVGRLEEFAPLLARMGIEVEHFGGQTYVARSVPAALPDLDVVGVIHDLLSDAEESGGLRNASPRERLAARIACHASIKASQRVSLEETRRLVSDLLAADNPYTCPHGRPTMIRLTREQLDKQFKRT